LLLAEAKRIGRPIRIVEWPGGAPIRRILRVEQSIYQEASTLVSVPLWQSRIQPEVLNLAWRSILDIRSENKRFPIISGPAEYRNGWRLPIWERGEPGMSADQLRSL
jgi:hypothetical protein